jgi:hypothetical protein
MKKAVVALVLVVYGLSAMGATVNLHYCMNEFVGSSFWHNEERKCGDCCIEPTNEGCCKDEQKHFKLKDGHQKSDASFNYHIIFSFLPHYYFSNTSNSIFENRLQTVFPLCNPPPDKKLHVVYCSFRL